MSARAPGAPTNASTNRMRLNAQAGATTSSQRYLWQLPREHPSASNEYPLVATRHDPYDTTAQIKSEYAISEEVGGNWVVPFTGEDAQYLLRKRDDQEKALFDSWVMTKYDITDPAQNLMLQSIAPELFQRREELIDSQQALVSHYAKLRLRGAKSLDDLDTEWRIETGRLNLPKGPIWDPEAWRDTEAGTTHLDDNAKVTADKAWNEGRYAHGMFSPLKWLTEKTSGWEANTRNRADVRGVSGTTVTRNIKAPSEGWASVWGGNPVMYPKTPGNLVGDPDARAMRAGRARAAAYEVERGDL